MRQNLQEILTKIFNLKIFIVTLIIWAILNFSGIQNLFFTSGRIEHIVFFKGLHFIFLYSLFNIFYHIYKNRKNPKFKHGIIIFSIFCVILFIFLLLLWPGTFGWDMIYMLGNIF